MRDAAAKRGREKIMPAPVPWSATESPQGLAESPQGLAESPQGLAESPQGLAEKSQGLAEKSQGLAEKSQGLAGSPQGLAEKSQGLAGSPQGLAGSPRSTVAGFQLSVFSCRAFAGIPELSLISAAGMIYRRKTLTTDNRQLTMPAAKRGREKIMLPPVPCHLSPV
ncbi:MAG: hypothetical protein LBC77_06425 [Spirochaetaceae bacterium]|jgi:hypothetical protein|nr:hypothetical protein [Spirochaetaceae bacterium]